MYKNIKTICPRGIGGREITIEVDSCRSLPTIDIIGLPDSAIKESKERLRATFRHCDIDIPPKKFIINLAPSDVKKSGTLYDVAIAVGLLCSLYEDNGHKNKAECLHVHSTLHESLFFGELGLDGTIRKVTGLLPAIISGIKRGFKTCYVPYDNIHEVSYITGIAIIPVKHFRELFHYLIDGKAIEPLTPTSLPYHDVTLDQVTSLDHIIGHTLIKRQLAIAIAGGHNVLMVGSPGTGKTMLARAMRGLLPPMTFSETLEASQIYSLKGLLHEGLPCITQRPFRHIHHTASKMSIIGGGSTPTPGEISLAHTGVLFLDEMAEFPRELLDTLRQPLEDKKIVISRIGGTIVYPAQCLVIGAMNPCICGYFGDHHKTCTCSLARVKKYQQKISGPIMDRMDMILHIQSTTPALQLPEPTTDTIQKSIRRCREHQQKRYNGSQYVRNGDVSAGDIHTFIPLSQPCHDILHTATKKLGLSLRVVHKIIKIARTIADYEEHEEIEIIDLAEAINARNESWKAYGND